MVILLYNKEKNNKDSKIIILYNIVIIYWFYVKYIVFRVGIRNFIKFYVQF